MKIYQYYSRILAIGIIAFLLFNCSKKSEPANSSFESKLENILINHSLDTWYPRVIDETNGGYYSTFSFDWSKEKIQNKFIVTQARHVWTLSKVYEFYPDRSNYKNYAQHGYIFLRDHMWDMEFGGFYQLVDSTGTVPDEDYAFEKRAYGNSFAIYALAAYYKLSKDEEVLALAKKAFLWLDEHAHDPEFGGYFQYLERDGTIIPRSVLNEGYNADDKAMVGLKDYNSSIHLLEAFTELYGVWPDELVKSRLQEMFKVVFEIMYDQRGFLKLHFHPDWTMVDDQELIELSGAGTFNTNHITFGHDVETAFLLIEAAEALGMEGGQIMPKAKLLVDHSLEKGWDTQIGGFYEQGKYIDGKMKILDYGKNWWAQAEGMNSLLLMHMHFPNDPRKYYQNFELMVDYIDTNLLDHQNLGWYSNGIDHHPEMKTALKANIWKGNYHTVRSLMHCLSMLDQLNH